MRFTPHGPGQHLPKVPRELVLEAVRQDGRALQFTSPELCRDREVVMDAVRQSRGRAFRFASPELRRDREFVLEAVLQDVG